jgi:hypothetical protein
MMFVARQSATVTLPDGQDFYVRAGRAYDDDDDTVRWVIDKFGDWFDSGLGDEPAKPKRRVKAS